MSERDYPDFNRARFETLVRRANRGRLTPAEAAELREQVDAFEGALTDLGDALTPLIGEHIRQLNAAFAPLAERLVEQGAHHDLPPDERDAIERLAEEADEDDE